MGRVIVVYDFMVGNLVFVGLCVRYVCVCSGGSWCMKDCPSSCYSDYHIIGQV